MITNKKSDDFVPAHYTIENQINDLVNEVDSLVNDKIDKLDRTNWSILVHREPYSNEDTYNLSVLFPLETGLPDYDEKFTSLFAAQLELRRQLQRAVEHCRENLLNKT